MNIERSIKPNGYKVKSWGDVVAVATLLSMFLGVVAWGLKLEGRNDTLQLRHTNDVTYLTSEINSLKLIIAAGVLPRADERLRSVEKTDQLILERVRRLEDKL